MAQIEIALPEPLQELAGGALRVTASGPSVGAALADLGRRHRLLVQRILTRGGALRPHVNLFLNQDDIGAAHGLDTALAEGDVLTVVPSVAGG